MNTSTSIENVPPVITLRSMIATAVSVLIGLIIVGRDLGKIENS